MKGIGVGLGIDQTVSDANYLLLKLNSIYKSNLIGLWVGDDVIVDGYNNITSWPGRVGGTLTNQTGSYFTKSTISNKSAVYTASATVKALQIDLGIASKSVFAVATSPTLPFSVISPLVCTSNSSEALGEAIQASASASSLYTGSGWTQYIDGETATLCTSGNHIYQSDKITNALTKIRTGHAVSALNWLAQLGCIVALSDIPTLDQRIKTLEVLGNYYGFSAQKILAMQISAIFGSSLIAAYIGEDLVVDGYNLVTSWPGQVGPTLTNTNSSKFSLGTLFGKKAITNSVVDVKMLQATLSTPMKEAWAVAKATAVPFDNFRSVVMTDAVRQLVGGNGTSNWYGALDSVYRDGYNTALVDTNGHIYSGYIAGSVSNELRVGNDPGSGATRTWLGEIGLVLAVSTQATSTQREKVLSLIGNYYEFNAQKKLAIKLNTIFGNYLVGAYIGDDLITDGNGFVTSWPGQVGQTLTNVTANRFITVTSAGRKALAPGVIAEAKGLGVENNTAFLSIIAVADGTPYVSQYECIADRYDSSTNAVIARASSGATWYAGGWGHRDNGVLTENIPTSGTHIFEATNSSNAFTGVRIGGWASGNRTWPVPINAALYLTVVSSDDQRCQAIAALGEYYNFSDQQILTMQMQAIFGANLVGLYIGEDMVFDGYNNVLSWPGRVGATLTYSPNSIGQYTGTILANRQFAWTTTTADNFQKTLIGTEAGVIKSVWAVTKQRNTALSGNAQVLISSGAGNTGMLRTATTATTWYTTGWTYYKKTTSDTNVQFDVVTIYSADNASGASTGIGVMGYWSDTPGRGAFVDPFGFAMVLGSVPSAPQRALATSLIQAYYSIP